MRSRRRNDTSGAPGHQVGLRAPRQPQDAGSRVAQLRLLTQLVLVELALGRAPGDAERGLEVPAGKPGRELDGEPLGAAAHADAFTSVTTREAHRRPVQS